MTGTRPPLADLYHTGVVVEDIHEAIAAYAATGAAFAEVRDITMEVVLDGERRMERMLATYTKQGPGHVELIQELEGGIWGPSALNLNHVGYWVEDVESAAEELEKSGFKLRLLPAARPPRLAYLSGPGNIWVELVGPAVRPSLEQWLATSYAGSDALPTCIRA
ncbi:VOC family protein [Streptomyces sp. NPDC097610]|uniref:VOC family protein n=1 Tax=Streptomyces sp. NPDC097610 TaxID=3157227 RepID=UPI003330AD1D